jgi:hypothetical protein
MCQLQLTSISSPSKPNGAGLVLIMANSSATANQNNRIVIQKYQMEKKKQVVFTLPSKAPQTRLHRLHCPPHYYLPSFYGKLTTLLIPDGYSSPKGQSSSIILLKETWSGLSHQYPTSGTISSEGFYCSDEAWPKSKLGVKFGLHLHTTVHHERKSGL